MEALRFLEDVDRGKSERKLLLDILAGLSSKIGLSHMTSRLMDGLDDDLPSDSYSYFWGVDQGLARCRADLQAAQAMTLKEAGAEARRVHKSALKRFEQEHPDFVRRLAFLEDLLERLVGWQITEPDADLKLRSEIIKARLIVSVSEVKDWLLQYRNPGDDPPVLQTAKEYRASNIAWCEKRLAEAEASTTSFHEAMDRELPLAHALKRELDTLMAADPTPA